MPFVKRRGCEAADLWATVPLSCPSAGEADERKPTVRKPVPLCARMHPGQSRRVHWGGRALQRHVPGDCLHVAQDRRIENPRIVAGHLRIGVSEHFGDVFYGRSGRSFPK